MYSVLLTSSLCGGAGQFTQWFVPIVDNTIVDADADAGVDDAATDAYSYDRCHKAARDHVGS